MQRRRSRQEALSVGAAAQAASQNHHVVLQPHVPVSCPLAHALETVSWQPS